MHGNDRVPLDVIGLDIGGTSIKAAIVSRSGKLNNEISIPTPVKQGKEAILADIKQLIQRVRAHRPETIGAIGVGSAGRIDRNTGRVLYATDNLPGWMGTDLKAALEEACLLPVHIDNDVNAAALGEGWLGAGQGSSHYVLITLGTGVGGALVHDGRLINGPLGGAGEIGHMILYPRGLSCNCGQSGCLEQYVSGTSLNRAARHVNAYWNSHILMERLKSGDAEAVMIIEKFTADLAVALVSVQNLYDPECIILGGGLIDTHQLWWEMLKTHLIRTTTRPPQIVSAKLGNKAGILGAAKRAFDETSNKSS